ncbi:hypothetical protein [Synechococcus elongatus]|uniref:hypothetical protein n=1 Tax=Synechococcus elongatus TaxID=32046 RepID=UPI0030D29F51
MSVQGDRHWSGRSPVTQATLVCAWTVLARGAAIKTLLFRQHLQNIHPTAIV